jgi:hypothetical protein
MRLALGQRRGISRGKCGSDFSRWMSHVFGDHALANDLRAIEERHPLTPMPEIVVQLVGAVRARYDLSRE